jgi:signal transduction histidine kinase
MRRGVLRRSFALVRAHGDAVLAAGISALTVVELATNDWLTGPRLAITAFSLVSTIAIAWRRRAPLTVALVVAGTLALQVTVVPTPHPPSAPFVAWVIAVFSVSAYEPWWRALLGGTAIIVAIDVWNATTPQDGSNSGVFLTLIVLGFWIAGRVLRSRNLLALALEERTKELEVEREERARLAVAEERSRIARELHDVIAHTLSVIVVQAGAERLVQPPGSGRDTLESIERTSRESLAEMGRLLGMLRTDGSPADLAPQPSLDRLDDLLTGIRAAGVEANVEVIGTPRSIHASLDVSAFRIVQEAITNSIKHGRATQIDVRIRWTANLLSIEVADDGRGTESATRPGYGLIGLRERVALFHGALVTGPSDLGGFLLTATLPTSAA